MKFIEAKKVQGDLNKLVEETALSHEPIQINGEKKSNAVLVAEDDWKAIQETLYLLSV